LEKSASVKAAEILDLSVATPPLSVAGNDVLDELQAMILEWNAALALWQTAQKTAAEFSRSAVAQPTRPAR
jgi:hypothetical protein